MDRGNVVRRLSTRSVANRGALHRRRILAKGGKEGGFLTQVKAQHFLLPYNKDKGTVKVEI